MAASKRKSTTSTPAKRAADVPSSGSKRSSTRIKATPTKSPYFDGDDSDEEPGAESEASGWEDGDQSAEDDDDVSEEDLEDEDEDVDEEKSEEEDDRPRKRTKTGNQRAPAKDSPTTATVVKGTKGKELWRPGVKAGLGAGKQVVIDLPKAREAGKTPYKDETIHPNTMLFLE